MNLFKKLLGAVSFSLAAFVTLGASSALAVNTEAMGYRTLDTPQHVESGKKVEVIEFFYYACPHCNVFDPALTEWVKKQGDTIAFKRVPVAFYPNLIPLQKLFYGLEALNKLDEMHSKIFHAIHVERQQLGTDAQVTEYVVKQGIDKQKFLDAVASFGVQTKLRRATQLAANYKVDMVPLVAIDGRYLASPSLADKTTADHSEQGLGQAALKVMDGLVAKSLKK